MKAYRETDADGWACGCTHDIRSWLEMCAKHAKEFEEVHAQARADHDRQTTQRNEEQRP